MEMKSLSLRLNLNSTSLRFPPLLLLLLLLLLHHSVATSSFYVQSNRRTSVGLEGKGGSNWGAMGDMGHEEESEKGREVYPTGSTLPDCTHACGACSPCKRVVVSFKCSTAESCPVVYRCMCNGKFYHVPSNA